MMTTCVVVLVVFHAVDIAKARPRASWTSSQVQRRTTPCSEVLVLSSASTAGLLRCAAFWNDSRVCWETGAARSQVDVEAMPH
jgi:hypothetical protein